MASRRSHASAVRIRDEGELKALRRRLRTLRYTESEIARRIRVPHPAAAALHEYPLYVERLTRIPGGLSQCIALFFLQSELHRSEVDAALGAELVDGLIALGLLSLTPSGAIAAAFSIHPCAGFHFVTDHRFRLERRGRPRAPSQPVMHLGQDSYALAYLTAKVPPARRALDLCCGSGVHGILAAQHGAQVVGIDSNPRAVELARLNALLNGVAARCDFRCGSVHDPIAAAEARFDLILANPPFVPSPRSEAARRLFEDGGPSGDAVLAPLVRGLTSRLAPQGVGAIFALLADREHASAARTLRSWCTARRPLDCVFLAIQSMEADEFVLSMTWRGFDEDFATYRRRYREWADSLKAERIVKLTYGVLIVRPSSRFSFRRLAFPAASALDPAACESIDQLLHS